ncbi:MAG: aldehyde ferredoxin oxidoreductase family protein, partial [Candidatus Thorarchaeota archaeon]
KNTSETTRLIKEELGDKFNVACIGVAGENLVKYAAVMNDCDKPNYGRAAGRCGMGTVMGVKKVKALASKGSAKIEVANPDDYKEEAKQRYDWVNQSLLKMTLEVFGTATMVDLVGARGGLPTRNFQTGVFPNLDKINGTTINETILTGRKPCFACPIACGRISEIKEGKWKSSGEGPEYETIGALGTSCGVDDLEAITMAHFLCNEYGIDVISAGGSIAFAMECYEKGILTKEDTNGLEFNFGNADLLVDVISMIGKREGIGDLIAEGSRIMAEKLGHDSIKFAMQVKGLELPAYDSRAAKIAGLGFAVANRGGCHITGFIEGPAFLSMPFMIVENAEVGDVLTENPEDTKVNKEFEDAFGVFDSIGGCKFMGMVLSSEDWASLIQKLLGYPFTVEDFAKTGERLYNLARVYNVREGITRADDTLPARLLEEPMPEGPAQGQVVNLEPLLDAYYEYRGWDKETGKPTKEKLKELGLGWTIDMIY